MSFHQSELRIYELATGKECFHYPGEFISFKFCHDSQRLAIGDGVTGTVWDIASRQKLAELKDAYGISSYRDGEILGTTGNDGNYTNHRRLLQLWDASTLKQLPYEYPSSTGLVITGDARFAADSFWSDEVKRDVLRIWELSTGDELAVPALDKPFTIARSDNPYAIRISIDNEWFEWNFKTKKLLEDAAGERVTLDRQGAYGNARAPYSPVRVELVGDSWQVTRDGQKVKTFPNESNWSHDGNMKLLICDDLLLLTRHQSIEILDINQGKQVNRLSGQQVLAVSVDGQLLLTSDENESSKLCLWHTRDKRPPSVFYHERACFAVFSTDGQFLATEGRGVKVWSVPQLIRATAAQPK